MPEQSGSEPTPAWLVVIEVAVAMFFAFVCGVFISAATKEGGLPDLAFSLLSFGLATLATMSFPKQSSVLYVVLGAMSVLSMILHIHFRGDTGLVSFPLVIYGLSVGLVIDAKVWVVLALMALATGSGIVFNLLWLAR